jgi:hypothetical protein
MCGEESHILVLVIKIYAGYLVIAGPKITNAQGYKIKSRPYFVQDLI